MTFPANDANRYPTLFDVANHLAPMMEANAFPVVKRGAAQNIVGNWWLQKGSAAPCLQYGENGAVIGKKKLSGKELAHYTTVKGIIELNREGIEVALDRRVALFFQQAILCYNMPFVFSARGADDQIGTAPALVLTDGKTCVRVKREAAHSSTLPTLYATPKAGGAKFVYCKGGHSHQQHNATIGMDQCVNGADELVDGKGSEDGRLREQAVKILNLVADGLDPVAGTLAFLTAFEEEIDALTPGLERSDPRRAVLLAYRSGIEEIHARAQVDRTLFDQLIGIHVGGETPEHDKLRTVLYQRRYDMIRAAEAIENRIGKKIADAREKMGARDRSLLEMVMLKEFSSARDRKVLEKLLSKTAAVLEEECMEGLNDKEKTGLKSFQTRIRNLHEQHQTVIAELKRALRASFRELSSMEMAYRARLFKDLRQARGWTQREFCAAYLKATGERVSQAWVSRMEQLVRLDTQVAYLTPATQRRRYVTFEDVKKCAKVFDIDAGLFLPGVCTQAV